MFDKIFFSVCKALSDRMFDIQLTFWKFVDLKHIITAKYGLFHKIKKKTNYKVTVYT